MSQENVEVVRNVYEAWARGDFRAGVDLYDPSIVFIEGTESPDAGEYVGRDGVRAYMRKFLQQWSTITIEAEELIDAGDSVVATVLQRMEGDKSGVPLEVRYFQVWSFRGRAVIRLEVFSERADAFAAVDLGRDPGEAGGYDACL